MKKLLLVLMLTLSVGAISTVSFTACSGGGTTTETGGSTDTGGGSTDTGGGAGDAGATGG